jgi:hypothetical protein
MYPLLFYGWIICSVLVELLLFFPYRLELIKERERKKAEEIEATKRSLMQSGMVRKNLVFPLVWWCYNYGASSIGYGLLAF